MDKLQFYPTPPDLAIRAWKKFRNTNFRRVLEPHGGDGDLATTIPSSLAGGYCREIIIDCCEIDLAKHPSQTSHSAQQGLERGRQRLPENDRRSLLLALSDEPSFCRRRKACPEGLGYSLDAEIVAILNAETIRNPFSRERQYLADLIERHGEVEFIEGAFAVEDAERKTDVDIALVYLRKTADVSRDIVGDLFAEMERDEADKESLADGYRAPQELALPNSYVENSVRAFNAAVRAMREAVFAESRANYYAALLGETMAVRNGDGAVEDAADPSDSSVGFVQGELVKRYLEVKDRAWASVLRSSDVTSRLSSSAQRRVESEFEQIKKFEFTCENIYAFLLGIIQSQGDIQIDMICDCFDTISRYHTDNAALYKRWNGEGWKSNDKHRTQGLKIKSTRFILPGHGTSSWCSNLSWSSGRLLDDFDKVFSLLDGKSVSEVSMRQVFSEHFKELCGGARLGSSYFDLRFYPGKGTIHFFPRRPDLIDRLNRVVGRHRQWIPPADAPVAEAFWLQYDKAEKFDREFRAEVKKMTTNFWDDPIERMMSPHGCNREQLGGLERVTQALDAVLERHGISTEFLLEERAEERPLLLAA